MSSIIGLPTLALPTITLGARAHITFFLPDSEPTSLVASIIATDSGTTSLVINCPPTTDSPDLCRGASIYPASVYRADNGALWGGVTTFGGNDSTTTWRCNVAQSRERAVCGKTIVSGGETRAETTTFDHCYVLGHEIPLQVTEGLGILSPTGQVVRGLSKENLDGFHSSWLSVGGCSVTGKGPMWIATATRAGGTAAETGGGAGLATAGANETRKSSGAGDWRTPRLLRGVLGWLLLSGALY